MLQGIKILDFTSLLPGPYATMMLGDLGAEILKIVPPTNNDIVNEVGGKINGNSIFYRMLHRNKTIIPVDLKQEDVIERVKQLVNEYDVIIEGFRPGVMKRLGLDYEILRKINPEIIYCSLTGYGSGSKLESQAGHDINYLSQSGVAQCITDSGKPVLPTIPLADLTGGSLHAVIGILAAIISRKRTGKGEYIDVSMLDTSFSLTFFETLPLMNQQLNQTQNTTNPHDIFGSTSFYGYYSTKDKRYLSIGGLEPKFFRTLLNILDIPLLNDVSSFDPIYREKIQEKIGEHLLAYWVELFQTEDICVEPVMSLKDVIESQHVNERELIIASETGLEKYYQIAHPIKYRDFKPQYEELRMKDNLS